MKHSSSLIPLLLALSFSVSNFKGVSQPSPDFSGIWKTGEEVLVKIKHESSGILVNYINPGDCASGHGCILGSGAEYYLKGTVSGNKMDLTMMRCTHDKDMRDDGLSERYTTTCQVTTVTDKLIAGTYHTEYYKYETKNGKKINFTRDPGGDRDAPFSLTRTNCKEELENLVAEIDRKAEALQQQRDAINDVEKNSEQATDGWYKEVGDQLKEDAFQFVVPPSVKSVPGAFDQDLGGYIESWTDFIGDLAGKAGNYTLEKAAKIVSLYDLLIDWGNVIAKGTVTLDEVDQMSNELSNMGDLVLDNLRAWVNAMLEYEKMRKLCADEIPLDKQPRPKVQTTDKMDHEQLDRLHEESNRLHGSINSGLQSAKTELTKTANAVENFKQLLEPYRNADKNKTMKQVMTATEITELQNRFVEAGRNWINLFKQLKSIDESRKKLKKLYPPLVG